MKFRKQNFRELERENSQEEQCHRTGSCDCREGGWCSIGGGVTITLLVVERGKSQVRKSLKTREAVGWWRSSGEGKLKDKCNVLALFGLLDL